MDDRDLDRIQSLTDRIFSARALLGDQTNPAQLILRKKGASHALFRMRIKRLRALEMARDNLVRSLIQA